MYRSSTLARAVKHGFPLGLNNVSTDSSIYGYTRCSAFGSTRTVAVYARTLHAFRVTHTATARRCGHHDTARAAHGRLTPRSRCSTYTVCVLFLRTHGCVPAGALLLPGFAAFAPITRLRVRLPFARLRLPHRTVAPFCRIVRHCADASIPASRARTHWRANIQQVFAVLRLRQQLRPTRHCLDHRNTLRRVRAPAVHKRYLAYTRMRLRTALRSARHFYGFTRRAPNISRYHRTGLISL